MRKNLIVFSVILLFCGVITAQNQNQEFLNAQFLILDEVQQLMQAERDSMTIIFYEEFSISGIQDIAFNKAMLKTLTNFEYFEHYYSDVVANKKQFLYDYDLVFYSQKMGLDDVSLGIIKPQLSKRAKELAICEACLIAYPELIEDCKEEVIEDYFDEISAVYIENVLKEASNDIRLVLQNRDWLNLSGSQIDSIVVAAQIIKKLTAENIISQKENNCWILEREFILQNLNEHQKSDFAFMRHAYYALNYSNNLWAEGKVYRMDFEYDSVQVLEDLFGYQVKWASLQYIYYDEKEKMKVMEDSLYKDSYPEFLTKLATERRKRNNEEEDDKRNLTF